MTRTALRARYNNSPIRGETLKEKTRCPPLERYIKKRYIIKSSKLRDKEHFTFNNVLDVLLYIQLTISFLIGRKRTVNFQNQRLGRHLSADYTIYSCQGHSRLRVIMSCMTAVHDF